MRWAIAGLLMVAAACTARSEPAAAGDADKTLYYALEVKQEGRVVARPQLLGETDRTVRAERRLPGASAPDYQLVLKAREEGGGYRLSLHLKLPDAEGHTELAMAHGEVRQVELGAHPGDLQVSLTLMRVDSPEFRALMHLTEEETRRASARSI